MKKGELRREAIVRTAERLFFEKGYEETSIQDILDELSISKGGFYHHFDSKISLLEEICRQRIESEMEQLRTELRAGRLEPVQKLNRMLASLFTIGGGDPAFAALVLKVSYLDGDVRFRDQMRALRIEALRPLMDGTVAEGIADGSLFSRYPGSLSELLLQLGSDLNEAICRILARDAANPECAVEILERLDAYRDAVELLSGAPFGKIPLFALEPFLRELRQTAQELNLLTERT